MDRQVFKFRRSFMIVHIIMKILRQLVLLAVPLAALSAASPKAREWTVFVGTYTQQDSKGIYAFRFDSVNGSLAPIGLVAETRNPSFLAVSTDQKFLYAVNENSQGTVTAFFIDPATSSLTSLNTVSVKGSAPCHLTLDKTGRWLFVANYSSGSVAMLPVAADGRLGEATAIVEHSGSSTNAQRQTGPHAHSVNVSRDNRFLFVSDLGLDKVMIYRIDTAKGALIPSVPAFAKVAAGSGPRHLALTPSERFAYVLNEMASTVSAFQYDKRDGSFAEIQTVSTLPAGYSGSNSGAEIAVHTSGRFLYSSNRGHDSISVFAIDSRSGKLSLKETVPTRGKTPRNFAIDPAGKFLLAANQNSRSISVFRIDQKSGGLTFVSSVSDIASPVSLVFAGTR